MDLVQTLDPEDSSHSESELDPVEEVCQKLHDTKVHDVEVTHDVSKRFARIVTKYATSSQLDTSELMRVSKICAESDYDAYVGVSDEGEDVVKFKITLLSKNVAPKLTRVQAVDNNPPKNESFLQKRPFIESIRSMMSKRFVGENKNTSATKPYLKSLQNSGMIMPLSVSECAEVMVDCISHITDARGHNILLRKSVDVRLISDVVVLSTRAYLPGTVGVRLNSVLEVYERAKKLTTDIQEQHEQRHDNNRDALTRPTNAYLSLEGALALVKPESTSTLTSAFVPYEFQFILTIKLPNTKNEFRL